MSDSTCSITWVGHQPDPDYPDRTYLAQSSDGKSLYAVTTTTCSCPWAKHNPEHLLDHPCKHLSELLRLIAPPANGLPDTRPSEDQSA